ncbi:prestin-like [Physella acuta]|uniref:prestin-like n=1 Tax=Physella acuta TaxID=109671 RepID=UPI0027DBD0A6|nr:prestin-like [Physella acuta]
MSRSDGSNENDDEIRLIAPELHPCLRDDAADGTSHAGGTFSELTPEGDKAKAALKKQMKRKHSANLNPPKRNAILKKSVEKLKTSLNCCKCTRRSCGQYLKRLFPFTTILNGYSALYDLPCDVIAGLTVGIMHIPQGMAYALLTTLPPVYGLYTSFFPVLVYFFFGTSRHISVGTFAVVCLMVGGSCGQRLRRLAAPGTPGVVTTAAPATNSSASAGFDNFFRTKHLTELESIKVGYAMAVTFAVGLLQVFLGFMRLGFLTTFLSDPLISGFTTGAAIHVFSSQIKSAFGVKVQRFSGPLKLVFAYHDFFSNIQMANVVTMSITLVTILVLVAIREGINNNKTFKAKLRGIPVPGELIALIVGTILSHHFHLHREFNVEVIGHIPKGFPTASLTFVKYLPDVIGESFAICFTAFATSFAISKILADKHNYIVDSNQELIAHGVSNVLGSMFSSFCSAASLSRSMVQDGVGGRTQIVSLFSTVLVVIVLLALGPLFEDLPNSVLAAIIIVSLKGLFYQFVELKRLWRVSKVDYTVWLVTFVATVLLDVDLGLLIGLIYNLVPILLRTQEPYSCLLGHLPNTDIYVDMKVYREAVPVPGVKIFKFEAPLYFANMENFKAALVKATNVDPHYMKILKEQMKDTDMTLRHSEVCMAASGSWTEDPCESHNHGRPLGSNNFSPNCETFAIIIDGSAIQYVDSVTVRILKDIVLEYRDVDIDVYLGECKAPVRIMLDKSGFYNHVYRRNVCATIHHAVQVAQKSAAMSRETIASTFTMAPEDFLKDGEFVKLEMESSAESVDKIVAEINPKTP